MIYDGSGHYNNFNAFFITSSTEMDVPFSFKTLSMALPAIFLLNPSMIKPDNASSFLVLCVLSIFSDGVRPLPSLSFRSTTMRCAVFPQSL